MYIRVIFVCFIERFFFPEFMDFFGNLADGLTYA